MADGSGAGDGAEVLGDGLVAASAGLEIISADGLFSPSRLPASSSEFVTIREIIIV